MVVFSGILTGLFSAILLFLLYTSIWAIVRPYDLLPFQFSLLVFLVVWIASGYGMAKGTKTGSQVWARGGLVGAVEWMLVGLFIIVAMFGGLVSLAGQKSSSSGMGGALVVSGFFTTIGLSFILFMVICSLLVWFVAKKTQSEFGDVDDRVRCAECGESISVVARKCRFCGAIVEDPSWNPKNRLY